jgi:hypothetical protein
MSKIVLDDSLSGTSIAVINNNFQKIEDVLNNEVLFRDNPAGDPNEMQTYLDANGYRIINLPVPIDGNDAARLKDVQQAISGLPSANMIPFSPTPQITSTNVQAAIQEVQSHIGAVTSNNFIEVQNIAALRNVSKVNFQFAQTGGANTYGVGGARFYYDAADTTSADNGYSIIVATDAGRWKLHPSQSFTPEMFGAVGDGVTDDSVAVSRAHIYTQSIGAALNFLSKTYVIGGLAPLTSGRMYWFGTGTTLIKGNIVYNNPSMPRSADITNNVPYDPGNPFVFIQGINFQSPNSSYALNISQQYIVAFTDLFQLRNCKFYGQNGLISINGGTITIDGCYFYNTLTGMRLEACTNWSVSNSYWRNAAQYGVVITDNAGSPARRGGENIRFTNCEFDCCSVGVWLNRCMWTVFDGCLFDYCGTPLYCTGATYIKALATYFGAFLLPNLSVTPGYIASPVTGVAVYLRPYINGTTYETSAITLTNCELSMYQPGSTNPLFLADGFIPADPGNRYCERVCIHQTKFTLATTHAMVTMCSVSYTQGVQITNNFFISPNLSTTLTNPYIINNSIASTSYGNNTLNCYQSSVEVKSTLENFVTKGISMYDDTAGIQINNSSGTTVGQFVGSGSDRTKLFVGSALKNVGQGGVDSGGAGFRVLIVPN